MKLTELTGAKTQIDPLKQMLSILPPGEKGPDGYQHDILRVFMAKLEEMGFAKLGQGSYGLVFTHPGLDYCVKIFRADPAYEWFVNYSMRNVGNPTLPKFRGKVIKIDQDTRMVRTEKLTPLDLEAEQLIEWVDKYPDVYEDDKLSPEQFIESWELPDVCATYFTKHIGVLNTILDLIHKKEGYCGFDLHDGNAMMRGTTVVLTDPLYTKR